MAYRWLAGVVLVLSMGLAGCAGSSQYMVKADAPTAGPPPDKALVYVMRPSGMGFAINFQVWDRDQFIGLSQAKSYFAYLCAPGKHLFIGIAENKVAVEADLAPGKSYYILTGPRMGGWKARLAMDAVTQGSENWGTVETLKKDLEFIVPVPEQVQNWDAAKKAEVAALVDFFEKDPERAKYMSRLAPTDGR
jgi:hypothetical protein